ncbi:hypothetical protein [Trueperella pecoris]|uniref:Uncharacterized protein n=1 Tax=Trueperella pecoris TaxID=2733571 RepID=A0A7M1QUH5_9ACTO|nr:hypothetical protein [Trueperella pecoris]QOR45451.1 hypothetical protein INS88_09360 [Trueperella pecoris]
MTTVVFTRDANRTHIEAPFDRGFISAIKDLGGRWDPARKTWHVANQDVDRAREITMKFFGSDGTAETESDLVTVRMEAAKYYNHRQIVIGGRDIAIRWERDGKVKLGDDVVLHSGRFSSSGGSRANPCIGDNDAVLEIRGMLRAVAEANGLRIVDEATARKDALEARKAALLAEIAKIDAELATL